MLISILTGIVFGFLVSMPPLGPVIFSVISKGLHNKNHDGLTLGMGAALVDAIYAASAVGGIAIIIAILPHKIIISYLEHESTIIFALTLLGGAFVIAYGLKILITKKKIFVTDSSLEDTAQQNVIEQKEQLAFEIINKTQHSVEKFSFLSVFNNMAGNGRKQLVTGILLCFSSLTLPASWMAIAGVLKSYNMIEHSFRGGVLFSVGVFIGTYGWFFLLLKIIAMHKHRLGKIALHNLQLFAGIILILLGSSVIISALFTTLK